MAGGLQKALEHLGQPLVQMLWHYAHKGVKQMSDSMDVTLVQCPEAGLEVVESLRSDCTNDKLLFFLISTFGMLGNHLSQMGGREQLMEHRVKLHMI